VKHTAADFMIRRLSVFGLGKLGLPLAVLFAHRGMHTTAIDVDAALVEQLRVGKMPVLEPGLDALVAGAASRLNYTTDARVAADTEASIIMVSTPYEDARAALSSAWVEEACHDLCIALRERTPWRYHLVIISSTLLPGVMSTRIVPMLEAGLGRRAGAEFGIATCRNSPPSGRCYPACKVRRSCSLAATTQTPALRRPHSTAGLSSSRLPPAFCPRVTPSS